MKEVFIKLNKAVLAAHTIDEESCKRRLRFL